MILFRVDRKELTILVDTDPLNKYSNSSVTIDGRRRDRVTDRYIWLDDFEEAKQELNKAITAERRSLTSQIATLNGKLDSLEYVLTAQANAARKVVVDYNNDNWD